MQEVRQQEDSSSLCTGEVTAAHLTFPWQRRCVEVCRLRCLDFPSGVMISVALKILLLLAFGLLSSHSRLHGSGSYRVPWAFDEQACDVARYFVQLKCSLMPYLYAKAVEAHEDGTPVMRPMVFEFEDDPACQTLDMQYMLGESLLTAPIFSEDGSAAWYLPEGTWTNYLDGTVKEGGRFYKDRFDYFSLPLYVRENTLLAVGSVTERRDYDYAASSVLHLFALKDGKEAVCKIPDIHGQIVETVKAIRSGQKIVVTADGKNRAEDAVFALVMHDENGNMQEISVPAKGEAVLELI